MSNAAEIEKKALNLVVISDNLTYYLPVMKNNNCKVHDFKRAEIAKAVEIIDIYSNQQVFDAVFIDNFPEIECYLRALQKTNPELSICILNTPQLTDYKTSIKIYTYPVIYSLNGLTEVLKDIRKFKEVKW